MTFQFLRSCGRIARRHPLVRCFHFLTLSTAVAFAAGCDRGTKAIDEDAVKATPAAATSKIEGDADESKSDASPVASDASPSEEVATTAGNPGAETEQAVVALAPLEPAVPWPAASERLLTLSHGNAVGKVDFSSNGRRLLSASEDGTLRLWDATTGIELRRINIAAPTEEVGKRQSSKSRTDHVFAAFLQGDSTAVSFLGGTVQTWSLETGRQIARFDFPEMQQFALHPSADRFVVVDLNKVVGERSVLRKQFPRVVLEERDLATGELRRSSEYQFPKGLKKDEFVGWVQGVEYSPDGARLLIAKGNNIGLTTGLVEYDVNLDVWRDFTRPSDEFPKKPNPHHPFVFLRDGRVVDSGGQLFERESDRDEPSFTLLASTAEGHAHVGDARIVAISPDEKTVAFAADQNAVVVGDLSASGSEIPLGRSFWWPYGNSSGPKHRYAALRDAAFSPDGRRLATGCNDGTIRIWDLDRGEEVVRCGDYSPWDARSAAWDEKRLEAGFGDHGLRLFSGPVDEEPMVFLGHSAPVICVAASPEIGKAFSGGADRKLIAWDLNTGKPLHELAGHDAAVCELLVSPDGRRLVSRGLDNQLLLWDIETGFEITSLKDDATILRLTFSPNGSRLLTGNKTGGVALFDAESGILLHDYGIVLFEGVPILDLAFSPEGNAFLVTFGGRDDMLVLDVATGAPLSYPRPEWVAEVSKSMKRGESAARGGVPIIRTIVIPGTR